MLSFILSIFFLFNYSSTSNEMLVRVYVPEYSYLQQINLRSLDIAGRSYNEYFDLVVTEEEYNAVISSGLKYEVIADDFELLKEEFKGIYHSYSETNTILRNYANTYSSICILDSIGPSFQGRYILFLKISDNPGIEDPTEPGVLFDGLHHAREWATVEVVLFYADTLLKGYGNDPTITNLVDNIEIWLIPIVNVDGYVYDYPGQNWWRKNRKPFGGSTGTDPNRNYYGALNRDPHGDWCSVPSGASISNNPGSQVFCGAYSGWADVVNEMMNFHRTHDINANVTYHSYAEEVIWPWAYTSSMKTPDSIAYQAIASGIASRIHKMGSGYYVASGSLYPLTGSTDSWVYGFHHYIRGISCLSYCVEVGTSFYQPAGDLDYLVRENWKGALYFAQLADSIRDHIVPRVPAPEISVPDTATTTLCNICWAPLFSQWNNVDLWQLDHLENYSYSIDDIESGTSNWKLAGFTISTAKSHSSSHSLYSGYANNISNVAQTKYPYLVKQNDSLSFWCWFSLETNYDVTVVEVSENLHEWIQLDQRYTGSSGGWIQKKYSLEIFEGKAVYFRFRTVTDDVTLYENFYVDDIYPVPLFNSISVVDSAITDTFYTFSGLTEGEHFFRVRGHNIRGWGNYSNTEKTIIILSSSVEEVINSSSFSFDAVGDSRGINISYTLPHNMNVTIQLFDLTGRKVNQFNMINQVGKQSLRINTVKNAVWFVRFIGEDIMITEKVISVR